MIRDVMLDPLKLRGCIDLPKTGDDVVRRRFEGKVARIAQGLGAIDDEKRRIIDLYAAGQMAKDEYVAANVSLDEELDRLARAKAKLEARRPVDEYETLDPSIKRFGESARTRFERCIDFDSKRQFLLDHIKTVIFLRSRVTIVGVVPIEHDPQSTREFPIEGEIDRKAILSRPKKLRPDDPRFTQSRDNVVATVLMAKDLAAVSS
jgi:hypothetical protein